jgi:hypothetical protein
LKKARWLRWLVAGVALLVGCLILGAFSLRLPVVQENFGWRISEWRASIKYTLHPPEQAVFTPNPTLAAMVQSTLAAYQPTATPTPTPGPTAIPSLTPTPTIEPTALPAQVFLKGVIHEYQKWNNCGPATLAMALSYWGWRKGQSPIASYVKPNPRDKNVMPYELVDFVNSQTGLKALTRIGGDLDLIRRMIAAGFPVMIEKGFDVPGQGWMGHYQLLAGYDDGKAIFNAYDSYEGDFSGGKTLPVPYATVESFWPHFNWTFILIYPADRETEVVELLGPLADEQTSYQAAAQAASDRIYQTQGRDQFFAWFDRGSSLVLLRDYQGAAEAYDNAFQVYAGLDPSTRPWRVMWYQTGPYFAYFYTGRYYDVINLATQTLSNMSEPVLEESYYWRALARNALGDHAGAVQDLQTSLLEHPGFAPAASELDALMPAP